MQDKILLETRNLAIGYKKRTLAEKLTLQLHAGELVCLIGRNGTGKSTLLRTLAGLQSCLGGQITVLNRDLRKTSRQRRARAISVVLSGGDADCDSFTVRQIAALGRFPYTGWLGRLSADDNAVIQNALEQVDLLKKADSPFGELSDGERQRAMIARALAQNTELILLDEPTAHLDLPNKAALLLLLRQLAKNTGKAILLSIHELELSLQTADKIWLLEDSRIARGVPEDLVLAGSVAEAFRSNRFHFDENTGTFRMDYPERGVIRVSGEGMQAEWTRRALERDGYRIRPDAVWEVQCLGACQWKLTGNDHPVAMDADSLENLLYLLRQWEADAKE